MKNYEKVLKSIGLENNEAKVYLEAIKLGSTQASIIGKRLGIPRTTARYACEELVKKNLMNKIKKGNSMLFTAEKPSLLKNVLQLEKNKIEENENSLDQIMPELIGFYNPYAKLPKVSFYEGIDGAKKALEDSLTAKETIDSFVDVNGVIEMMNLNSDYVNKRRKSETPKRLIIDDDIENVEYIKSLYGENDLNKIKTTKGKKYFKNISFMVYDGKILYITLRGENIISVIIENDEIYEFHKNIFNLIWEKL